MNKRSVMMAAALVGVMVLGSAPAMAQAALPAGYERATDADLQGVDWKHRQGKAGRMVSVAADFNGDGRQDTAELLINRRSQTYTLFVFLAGSQSPIQLVTSRLDQLERMGIDVSPPGRFATPCSRGLDRTDPKCERGAKTIDVKVPSISYIVFESQSDNLYWNGSRFEQIWKPE